MKTFKRVRKIVGRTALCVLAYLAVMTVLEKRILTRQAPVTVDPKTLTKRIDADQLLSDVKTLSSADYAGRATGSAGSKKAQAFIEERFRALRLEPVGGSFERKFAFVHHSFRGLLSRSRPYETAYPDATNLIALVHGRSASRKCLLLSAHYDHKGVRDGALYPGADDNASGVAVVLAAGRYLSENPPLHSVLLVAFDGEELGLRGSKAFVESPPVPLTQVALAVNLDMVSRNDRNEIFAAGTFPHPRLRPVLERVQRRSAVRILFGHDKPFYRAGLAEDWTHASDHGPLHDAGVPFVYFGVADHPDYHQPTDTFERIDPAFFTAAAEMILEAVVQLDQGLDALGGA